MDPNKRMTGFIIHGFAVAHAVTAALFAQTLVGDEAALTVLTVAMIIAVARLNGANWSAGEALAFLGVFIGYYVGTRGATFLIKWIPGIGNAANATVTFATTEALGWATYLFVKKGMDDPKKMSDDEKERIWNEAKNLRETEEKKSKEAYNRMTSADKAEFDAIMKKLKDKNLSDAEREWYLDKLAKIAEKY